VPTFAELTTMHVGGPIGEYVEADSDRALVDAVRSADAAGVAVLVLGGGSNLVVSDAGWDGRVVRPTAQDVTIDGTVVRADAGLTWDTLVALTLDAGLSGLEQLSGVPGTVGGAPVQNVGAYGGLTSDVLASVTVYDRHNQEIAEWPVERLGFGRHRQSVFKHTDRYVILRATFHLHPSTQSAPLGYQGLCDRLGIALNGTASIADVRAAVLSLRSERGSIYDPADRDTWGTGSFFLNPVVDTVAAPLAELGVPQWPDPGGIKLPAGWLIDRAGFNRGYGADVGRGAVRLSSKHTLVLSNHGDATTAEVMAFARHIRDGVEAWCGVRLGPECDLVGCSFDDGPALIRVG